MGGGFLTGYGVDDPVEGDYYGGEGDYYGGEYGEGGDYYSENYQYPEDADTKLPDVQVRERRRRRQANQNDIKENEGSGDVTFAAVQTANTYMYDGGQWDKKAPMSTTRDRPACSIINMPDGKVSLQLHTVFLRLASLKWHFNKINRLICHNTNIFDPRLGY